VASELLPLFLTLTGRRVTLVGGGPVALEKGRALVAAGAELRVVAPEVLPELAALARELVPRPFLPEDLDGAWLVFAAAPPEVNRQVRLAGDARQRFVVAVDDLDSASAYGAARVVRGAVTVAISTSGRAPGLARLLRETLEEWLPEELGQWADDIGRARATWKRLRVPFSQRRGLLLATLLGRRAVNETTWSAPAASAGFTPAAPPTPEVRSGAAGRGAAEVGPSATGVNPGPFAHRTAPGPAVGNVAAHGRVVLVGAGPGAPELLTVRAVAELSRCELVLHDALVPQGVLAMAPQAVHVDVGRRVGACASAAERLESTCAQLIGAARRGIHVVRLKCGDPFVFGRGGEELLALHAAGISAEVVPGISSALAGPAALGAPVTHRGLATAVVVLTGHPEQSWRPLLPRLPQRGLTIVALMAIGCRAAMARELLASGWSSSTPAGMILGAGHERCWRWTGSLAALGEVQVPPDNRDLPGLLVIGEVVGVAQQLQLPPSLAPTLWAQGIAA
jgi:uroporphyrin-III C-methyltransferase/precorrin-2 dehydrogenase/sirohydrochlorin ferrochelatase